MAFDCTCTVTTLAVRIEKSSTMGPTKMASSLCSGLCRLRKFNVIWNVLFNNTTCQVESKLNLSKMRLPTVPSEATNAYHVDPLSGLRWGVWFIFEIPESETRSDHLVLFCARESITILGCQTTWLMRWNSIHECFFVYCKTLFIWLVFDFVCSRSSC